MADEACVTDWAGKREPAGVAAEKAMADENSRKQNKDFRQQYAEYAGYQVSAHPWIWYPSMDLISLHYCFIYAAISSLENSWKST